jgi:hypothetical protein
MTDKKRIPLIILIEGEENYSRYTLNRRVNLNDPGDEKVLKDAGFPVGHIFKFAKASRDEE